MFRGLRGLRMALDQLSIMRLLKGKLSKKAVAAQAVEHIKLECVKCGADSKVTLRKNGSKYICTHCVSTPIPSRRERRHG